MDTMDEAILRVLKENGRASASAIGKLVNLSVPAVLERMKKMTQAGIIRGYTAKIGREKMGLALLAFVLVRLRGNDHMQDFRHAAAAFACVLECHHLAGEYDYLLKVAVKDTAMLESFLTGELKALPGVESTNTMIALTTLKEEMYA